MLVPFLECIHLQRLTTCMQASFNPRDREIEDFPAILEPGFCPAHPEFKRQNPHETDILQQPTTAFNLNCLTDVGPSVALAAAADQLSSLTRDACSDSGLPPELYLVPSAASNVDRAESCNSVEVSTPTSTDTPDQGTLNADLVGLADVEEA